MSATACPRPEELAALADGRLSGDALERLAAHVDACPACLAAAQTAPTGDPLVAALRRAAARPPGDRYVPVRLHAAGGLGEVHIADDTELGRRVALKRIHPARADDPDARRRFLREAAITARLEHPGVVPVYGVARDAGGRPHYAMRLVAGESFHDAIARYHAAESPRSSDRQVAFRGLLTRFVAVCQTVAYAHSKGVIHRDVKPANVMLGEYGETLLVDWGLAKPVGPAPAPDDTPVVCAADGGATWIGQAVGTPAYMSPEQAAGRHAEVGPASDVYALGATLYALLTGRPPFDTGDAGPPPAGRGTAVPPRQASRAVPRALEAVCLKAMAADPADRYPSAAEVGAEVERWLAGEPVRAHPEGWAARAGRWARRHQVAVGGLAAGLLVAAVLGGGGGAWLVREAADRRAERARLTAKDRDAIDRALAELPGLVRAWRFREAAGLLGQTAAGLSEFAPADDRFRLDRARAEVALAERLDAVRLGKSALVEGKLNTAAAAPAYRAAFAGSGLDVLAGDPEDLSGRVAASAVREALLAALDDWAAEAPDADRRGRITRVARAADPHPWRDRFRDALARRDRVALRDLARQADVEQLTPAALAALGPAVGGQTPEAEQLFRRAQARYPGDFWVNFRLASALHREADRPATAEAVGYYRACLAVRPEASIVHSNLGGALLDLGDLAGADAAHRRALALDPESAVIRFNFGNAVRARGDMAGAADAYRQSVRLDPGFAPGYTNLGNALLELKDPAGAADAHRRAVALEPEEPRAHNNLGNTLRRLGDSAGAEAAFRRAVELAPGFAAAHANLGNTLGKRGDLAGAAAALRRATAIDPKFAGAHFNLGNALYGLNDPAGAETAYRRAGALDPGHARAHAALGKVLAGRGDWAGAADAYRRAADLTPRDPGAYIDLANTLMKLGRLADARAAGQRAFDLIPPGQPLRDQVAAGLQRAEQLIGLEGKLPAILRGEARPTDPAEHRALAELAALQGRPAAAARLYDDLLRANPPTDGTADPRRVSAASAAARAGCGQGADTPAPDAAERGRWRRQALDWLRVELTARRGAGKEAARRSLRDWQADPDLAGVRDTAGLAALPADERDAWRRFWADVAAALRSGTK